MVIEMLEIVRRPHGVKGPKGNQILHIGHIADQVWIDCWINIQTNFPPIRIVKDRMQLLACWDAAANVQNAMGAPGE